MLKSFLLTVTFANFSVFATRSFYKEQDELISMFENFSFEMDKENNEVMHTQHNTAYRLTQISFILNMVSNICEATRLEFL